MSIYSIPKKDLEMFESLKTFDDSEFNNYTSLYNPNNSGVFNSFYGKKHTKETLEHLSNIASLRVGTLNPNYGKRWSEEQKQVISKIHKGKSLTEEHKQKLSLAFTGEKNHQYGKVGELSPNFGKLRNEETKQKISESLKGRTLSSEHKTKLSNIKKKLTGINHPNYGKKYNMKSSTCPHCGKTGMHNMKRYHFDNCKSIKII